jgi:hypothetical protein
VHCFVRAFQLSFHVYKLFIIFLPLFPSLPFTHPFGSWCIFYSCCTSTNHLSHYYISITSPHIRVYHCSTIDTCVLARSLFFSLSYSTQTIFRRSETVIRPQFKLRELNLLVDILKVLQKGLCKVFCGRTSSEGSNSYSLRSDWWSVIYQAVVVNLYLISWRAGTVTNECQIWKHLHSFLDEVDTPLA